MLFAAIALISAAFGEVTKLTQETFKEKLKGNIMVKFFAPWCGHCRNLAPIYEELSTDVEGVEIAEVDCTVYQDICRDQGIRGYPTVKLFKANKEGIVYSGARTVPAFKEWLTNNIK
eukprot:gnl/Chilomastix_caulleri/1107.p1 GENE.gnl/Chilomastix_caulleri/1107~~gnl/Chilomastix_caulleri/1107.p1  ORF type:complete len:117 (+),score=33.74 gnl/Chilomastix_caulleri/1107:74-424(+)